MKKNHIALLLLLCLVTAFCLTSCGDKGMQAEEVISDPISYLKTGVQPVVKTWNMDDSQLLALLKTLIQTGEGQIELNLKSEEAVYELQNIFAFQDGVISSVWNGNIEDQNADLQIYLDKTDAIVQSAFLLNDDETYGINLETFFAQGIVSSLAQALELTTEHMNTLQNLCKAKDNLGTTVQTASQEIAALKKQAQKMLQNVEFSVTEETVTINETEAKAIAIAIPVGKEFAQSIINAVSAISQTVDDTRAYLPELEAEAGVWTCYLNQETGALMQCDVKGIFAKSAEKVPMELHVIFGIDPADVKQIDFNITTELNGETVQLYGNLAKSRKDKTDCFELDLNQKTGDEKPTNLGAVLYHNTGTDAYMLQFTSTEGDKTTYLFELRGSVLVGVDGADLTVHTMKVHDTAVDININARVTTKAELPQKPSYQNLLTLNETLLNTRTLNFEHKLAIIRKAVSYEEIAELYLEGLGERCFKCYNEATRKVEYLEETLLCCKDCAEEIEKIIDGDYCDACWKQNKELTVEEIYGVAYRLCSDCYEYMMSY